MGVSPFSDRAASADQRQLPLIVTLQFIPTYKVGWQLLPTAGQAMLSRQNYRAILGESRFQ
jgi:hypothetical protein